MCFTWTNVGSDPVSVLMTNPCLLSLRPLFSTYRESAQHSFGLFLFFHFEYPSYVLLISTEEYNDCRKNKWALDRESNREAREYVESVQMAKVTKVFVLLVKKTVFQTIYSATPIKYRIVFYAEFCFMNLILTHKNPWRKADGVQHWVTPENMWAKQGAVKTA